MKIKLESDFLDYYDSWFCSRHEVPDVVFKRMSKTNAAKWTQFEVLKRAGLRIPLTGYWRTFAYTNHPLRSQKLVVYTDPYAHAGEGKELVTLEEFQNSWEYIHYFASLYIKPRQEDETNNPTSYRLLAVDKNYFNLIYTGIGGTWQSNHAPEVQIKWDEQMWDKEELTTDFTRKFDGGYYPRNFEFLDKYPLWAIDYICDEDDEFWAIDFNTAPRIKGTGIEDALEAHKIYELIEEWFSSSPAHPIDNIPTK